MHRSHDFGTPGGGEHPMFETGECDHNQKKPKCAMPEEQLLEESMQTDKGRRYDAEAMRSASQLCRMGA